MTKNSKLVVMFHKL